jgi:hypothetical protein
MPITYSYNAQRGLHEAVVSGEVTLAEVEAYFRQVRTEPWFPAPSLTDVRDARPSLPSEDVRAIAELLRELGPTLRGAPIAVLVSSQVGYGLVRMIELLVDDVATVRPFLDPDAAMTWLDEQVNADRAAG